jgi:hypothetical protein
MDRKEYLRNYQREWIAGRRREFFRDKMCQHCGCSDALELHHLDPTTKIANAIWSWAEERRLIEIAKCIILCNSCHWQETIKQRNEKPITHGSDTAYDYHKCRCSMCKKAKSIRNGKRIR